MKGGSNLIMGLTLVVVVTLAMVLGLVLVLLAELYCSLLIRQRRRLRVGTPNASSAGGTITDNRGQSQPQSPLSSFYSQGVLTAPRSFLYPTIPGGDVENKHQQPPENQEPRRTQHQKGGSSDSSHAPYDDHLVYISNPIYDNENGRVGKAAADHTPFETPDTSPSRLETEDSSDDEKAEDSPSPICPSLKILVTPPLTPMKKLPAEACSVSLKDARSLGVAGSDSHSNNGVSSSSSGTPCTSPSW